MVLNGECIEQERDVLGVIAIRLLNTKLLHPGESKHATFYARHFLERLRIACTKQLSANPMHVSGLNEKEVEDVFYLLVFVWSPRSGRMI